MCMGTYFSFYKTIMQPVKLDIYTLSCKLEQTAIRIPPTCLETDWANLGRFEFFMITKIPDHRIPRYGGISEDGIDLSAWLQTYSSYGVDGTEHIWYGTEPIVVMELNQ